MKYLITAVRRLTENEGTVNANVGISDEEFLQYFNDAQDYLMFGLEFINRKPYTREVKMDSVNAQEAYDLPARTYLGHNVVVVEYALTGNINDYVELRLTTVHERDTTNATPWRYIIRNKQILLNPTPNLSVTNGIRIQYVERLDRLDKRRAQVDAITVSSGQVTALTVDITDYTNYFSGATAFSDTSILVDDYFSIVGADGAVKARNIPITAINTSTGVCTITSYTPEATTETGAINDYLVAGTSAVTNTDILTEFESFMIDFCSERIFRRDGNTQEADGMMTKMAIWEEKMANAYRAMSDDVQFVTVLNPRFNIV